ncbi:glycosyltransferase [uncultured Methylobacterium sp.]|uniref:glycosyltransferase n=1 Tax=uncultured Methylobacterium sp. TaxID=157278 RepID=UPI0035CB5C48
MRLVLLQAGHRCESSHLFLQDGLLGPLGSNTNVAAGDRIDGRFYVSATFPPGPDLVTGPAVVEACITWSDRSVSKVVLCTVEILRIDPLMNAGPASSKRVGIALATYNPDLTLFARQIASIRDQRHTEWLCVISDDGSRPETLASIADTVRDDPRFRLLPPGARLGFYRNFERACAALPRDCAFIAFSDQDDIWMPHRLATQLDAVTGLDDACCYSDMEIVDAAGMVLSPTFWLHRSSRYGNLNGLLLGNVVTGMTILARRELVERALPFPATPSLTYHDHWIGLVAERLGSLRYLPEPLVRYVQHGGNHTGALYATWPSGAILAQALRRIVRFTRTGLLGGRFLNALREPHLLDWMDQEPTRLRILVDRLVVGPPKPGDRSVGRLARSFGALRIATCGAAWDDNYRRGYAIELGLGVLLKAVILAMHRRGWIRRAAGDV